MLTYFHPGQQNILTLAPELLHTTVLCNVLEFNIAVYISLCDIAHIKIFTEAPLLCTIV